MKLKELLVSQEINAVYSTPYARTRATVAPTAKANELAVTEYKPMEKGFLKETLDKHLGETILIAGHSNTIPDLVNELIGDKKYSQLDENDYNYLFIVTVSEIGQGKEVVISYWVLIENSSFGLLACLDKGKTVCLRREVLNNPFKIPELGYWVWW